MLSNHLSADIIEKIGIWTGAGFETSIKDQINEWVEKEDWTTLTDSFYTSLEFGTGGMRGLMGAGTNKMNQYTVGGATQGLANYLKKAFPSEENIKVVIAHDSRNNSSFFTEITASVLSANGIHAYTFAELRPTPELSFAVRYLGAHAGIVITASHNPKEYNGYKVYWSDGGQIVPPHDKGIVSEVRAVSDYLSINFSPNPNYLHTISDEVDTAYLEAILSRMEQKGDIQAQADIPIVYTSIHGTGVTLLPKLLQKAGFKNVKTVKEQDEPNGNFPTVSYPNPEEAAALQMALELGKSTGAELILGTDPDSDRVGIAVKNNKGDLELLNGNQAAALLVNYILESKQKSKGLPQNGMVVKTIVTSELLRDIASSYSIPTYDVLTGFKYIAEQIKLREGKEEFLVGGEESYGYLVSDYTRDKDAIASAAFICEMACYYKNQGVTLYQKLMELYAQHGLYVEGLLSLTKQGKAGAEEIQEMMKRFRALPPVSLDGSKVAILYDYKSSEQTDLRTGAKTPIDLPKSDVLQFKTESGTLISIRPSGTEPKIKFYFGLKTPFLDGVSYEEQKQNCLSRIVGIQKELGLV